MKEQEDGTTKAKDLIRMGVAKAALLEPQEPIMSEVQPRALVIGGGIAGMTAALALGNRGYDVVMVEKEEVLGGMLNRLHLLSPTMTDAKTLAQEKIKAVTGHPNITVFTKAKVSEARGFIGKYEVDIETAAEYFPGDIITGNINPSVLQTGTPEDVYKLTKQAIEKGKKCPGGFMLAPGCEMPPRTPEQNILAMMQAVSDFGWYE